MHKNEKIIYNIILVINLMNRISLSKRVLLMAAVAVSLLVGFISMNQVFGQFGELLLSKPEEITEYHCSGNPLPCIDPGDTAFMYTAAVLVIIMTPGSVGFLYGGLTRRKNALTVILQAFLVYAIVSIQWVIWGYSLTFGPDATGHGFIGSFDWLGLNNVLHNAPADVYAPSIPHIAFVMFQLMFAAITPALAVAGYADRVKMSAFMIHVVLWSTFVYDFVGHWNWSLGSQGTSLGWLASLGALCWRYCYTYNIWLRWSSICNVYR